MGRRQENQDRTEEKLVKHTDVSVSAASHQISDEETQCQLDLIKERVTSCEAELKVYRRAYDIVCERMASHAVESVDNVVVMQRALDASERDYSGLRLLTLFSFAFSVATIIGIILYVIYL
jgi:hypothetical protein